jgi:1-acyl-sn-glycerol-3-phosphate acyltransferase
MFRPLKLVLLVIWIAACFCPAWIAKRSKKYAWRDRIACWCYKGILTIADIKITTCGKISPERPLLVVSNHISYLDVAILGSAFPFRFTPKKEIASWPLIASLCRVSDAIFLERKAEKFHESLEAIRAALNARQVVSLFPEATTGNGIQLQPFKSGLFHLADKPVAGEELKVQPVAIIYTRIHSLPIDSCQWPLIAWYGDMKLVPHLWSVFSLGRIDVTLEFLPPTTMKEQDGDRKRLSAYCQQAIADAIHKTKEPHVAVKETKA